MVRKLLPSVLTSALLIFTLVPAPSIGADAQSLPLFTRHVRKTTLNGKSPLVGLLPRDKMMRLVMVLPLRNQAALDELLQQLYDPASPAYHDFLTVEEFTSRFGPTRHDYEATIRFAEANGLRVTGTSRNRLTINVTSSVENLERALHVTLGLYRHPTENRTFYAPDREPTPDLAVKLWHISGLDNYSIPRRTLAHRQTDDQNVQRNATTGSGPGNSFLGSDMRAAYYGGTLTGSGQSVGLLEYYGTDLVDLDTYYTNVGQKNTVPITLLSTDGTSTSCVYSQGCDDTEQTLDMTQALGMAPGMASLVMYVGSSDSAIFSAMATAKPLNAQLSSSWVWGPSDPSTDNPFFEEFAAQGQNLFQAAGDWQEWTTTLLNEGEVYPADDVYITSVGGTDLETSSAGGPWSSETAWSDSGGGISPDDFAIPSWQTAAAAGCSSCSRQYRNGPDVAANANFTFYVCADQSGCTANYYGGTSFAAPMWAGFLALVNQQSVASDGKTLGFINPSLYALGLGSTYDSDFHDITSGSNGYNATVGYDLVTGWGSPNGPTLVNALLPTPGFNVASSLASVNVAQASSASLTITTSVTNGFDSPITLTATGQPTGVTVTFNPPSITGAGTSTMKITAAASAPLGTYMITVTGTSGSIEETATVTLTVDRPFHIHIQ